MARMWETTMWVLVADGERARVMVPDATPGRFRTLLWLGAVQPPHCPPPLRDQRLGRACEVFTADLARRLDDEAASGSYDQLVLMAPTEVLHDLRVALGLQAEQRLVGVVDATCSGINDAALSAQLTRWWLAPAQAA